VLKTRGLGLLRRREAVTPIRYLPLPAAPLRTGALAPERAIYRTEFLAEPPGRVAPVPRHRVMATLVGSRMGKGAARKGMCRIDTETRMSIGSGLLGQEDRPSTWKWSRTTAEWVEGILRILRVPWKTCLDRSGRPRWFLRRLADIRPDQILRDRQSCRVCRTPRSRGVIEVPLIQSSRFRGKNIGGRLPQERLR
jgi:hypothetical protein